MILARIVGTVVATRKDERLHGRKLLIVRPVGIDGADEKGHIVAVDTVGAGFRETVLVVPRQLMCLRYDRSRSSV